MINVKYQKLEKTEAHSFSIGDETPALNRKQSVGNAYMIDTPVSTYISMSAIKSVLKVALHLKRHEIYFILRSKYVRLIFRHFPDKLHQLKFKCIKESAPGPEPNRMTSFTFSNTSKAKTMQETFPFITFHEM